MLFNFLYLNQIVNYIGGFLGEKSCFPIVGCFENGYPWITLDRPVLMPENPQKTRPYLYFHNREFPDGIAYQVYPCANFTNFLSEAHKTTYVIVHGYTDNGKRAWITDLKDVLLEKKDANVFVLDFCKGGGGYYAQAVSNIRLFGKIYALAFMKTGIPASKFHIIGHSLGSHLAAYIGKEMKKMGQLVGWITGLDPAAPWFENYPVKIRLDASDAEFVDIHHTDSGVRGMLNPVGHVDFYYNGGTTQPCDSIKFDGFGCGHQMVHQYYISSIKNECLYGVPSYIKPRSELLITSIFRGTLTKFRKTSCNRQKCLQVGIKTKYFPQRGVFTIFLNRNPPFCSKSYPKDSEKYFRYVTNKDKRKKKEESFIS